MRRFILFIAFFLCISAIDLAKKEMAIEIIPFGSIEKGVLDTLKDNLAVIFNAEVSFGQSQPVPEYALNKRREQYFSSEILDHLARIKKRKDTKVLAVIDEDLYVPELNFVFGEADSYRGLCIVSLTRLRQSFYGMPEDGNLFFERA
jgi:archaemetzincin